MKSAISSISSGTAALTITRDAERLEPLREPRRVRVRDVAGDDLVADRQDRGQHDHRSEYRRRYPRRAGHMSPAGMAAAKPVRIRRCPATAMPRPPAGDEPGRLRHADERQPSEEGRFCGSRRRATSLRFTRRFFMVTRSQAPMLGLAALSRRSRSRCCSLPGRRRRPPQAPPSRSRSTRSRSPRSRSASSRSRRPRPRTCSRSARASR